MEGAIMKKFIEVPKVFSSKRQSVRVIEKGDVEWSPENAKKREEIIKEVGMEYKQINILALVLYEIVKNDTNLQNNEVIQEAMAKFERINQIRNS
jgi:hypothetical protein